MKFNQKFNNMFNFTLITFFKNPRVYIYSFLLPIIITSSLFFINLSFSRDAFNESILSAYLLIGNVVMIFSLSSTFFEWKKTVLLKQIKNFRIPHLYINGCLFIVYLLVSIIVNLINLLNIYIMALLIDKADFDLWIIRILKPSLIIGTIAMMFLEFLFMFGLAKILSLFIENIFILQTVNTFVVVFFLFNSNIFINISSYMHTHTAILIYFNPINYFVVGNIYLYINFFNDKNALFFLNPFVDQKAIGIDPYLNLSIILLLSLCLFSIGFFLRVKSFKR